MLSVTWLVNYSLIAAAVEGATLKPTSSSKRNLCFNASALTTATDTLCSMAGALATEAKLKHWRQVKKLAEYDLPAIEITQSRRYNSTDFSIVDTDRWRTWYFDVYASSARDNERAAAADAENTTTSPRTLTATSADPPADTPNLPAAPPQRSGTSSTRSAGKRAWVWGRDALTSLPSALITLPFRPDRRQHSLQLLSDLALEHVRIPALLLAEALNLSALVESGAISGAMAAAVARGDRSAGPYVARVMDQRAILTGATIYAGGGARAVCCV